jgi:hypothetical protein
LASNWFRFWAMSPQNIALHCASMTCIESCQELTGLGNQEALKG